MKKDISILLKKHPKSEIKDFYNGLKYRIDSLVKNNEDQSECSGLHYNH